MKKIVRNIIIYVGLFVVLAIILAEFSLSHTTVKTVDIGTLIKEINDQQVEQIVVKGSEVQITLKNKEEQKTQKESTESLSSLLANLGVAPEKLANVKIEVKNDAAGSFLWTTIVPFVLPIIIVGVILWFMLRQVQGANNRAMSFGQSQVKQASADKNKVSFKDVAGAIEAKIELAEVVDFLKNPQKFINVGAKIPKGVLLLGSPGTGKTLLARAVAGEANVPFFHISGSEFVEMFVGVGASRVRDLFKRARKEAPCIVFIDEIDAVGRQRGSGLGGSHDEREQTLNQILVEMDGFDNQTNVIVMAATNRPDVLDPALLRPGRFDRQVIIDMPDLKDRQAILAIHATNKPLDPDVDLKVVAQRTPGFSGADLANVLNEAAIATGRQNLKVISQDTILSSIEKVMLGPERKSKVITDKEKKIIAYHEAGHALVAHFLTNADPVHKISVISRGRAGGYTLKLPEEDRTLHSRAEFVDDLAVMLGGYAAEKIIFNDITTGASSDLLHATQLARSLVTQYGMSEKLGPRTYGQKEEMIFLGREIHERRDYSEQAAEAIDREVTSFIASAFQTADKLIREQKERLEKIVAALFEKETLERAEFEALMA
ncbi:MAG: ATP-dependent zinc metalloprotease FtsH [Candidatus Komeilibacteria bacterium]